jgi:hypothetical protein
VTTPAVGLPAMSPRESNGRGGVDPCRVVFDALEHHGCEPHGELHNFRASCPVHGGDNRDALKVTEGSDRRVLLWCHAHGCEPEAIVVSVGLGMGDLFPAGHHRAGKRSLEPVGRSDLARNAQAVASTLHALDTLRTPWRAMVTTCCPYCDSPGAWLRVSDSGKPHVDCPDGCTADKFTSALAGRLTLAQHLAGEQDR